MLYFLQRSVRGFTTISVDPYECTMKISFFSAVVFFCFLFLGSVASAQTSPETDKKVAEIEAEVRVAKARLALAEAEATLEAARKLRPIETASSEATTVVEDGKTSSTTTITASSKSKDAGKLELELAKLEAKVEIERAKATRPVDSCGGFWGWLNCPVYPVYGRYYGGYGYVQPYNSYGGYARPYGHSHGHAGVRTSGSRTGTYGRPRSESFRGGGATERYGSPGSEAGRFGGSTGTYGPSGSETGNFGGNTGPYGPPVPASGNFGGTSGVYNPPR